MSDDLLPCACSALRKAARAVTKFYDDALAPYGLTITQYCVLRNVSRLGDAPLSRLADALVMDRTSLYRTLQPMIREGWIAIRPGHGRSKVATLTDAGRMSMECATKVWEATQAAFLERFGAASWRGIDLGLQKAIEVVEPTGVSRGCEID